MARKTCVTESIAAAGIQSVTGVTVTSIEEGKVVGEKDGKTVEYPCDHAVFAIGSRSRNGEEFEEAARKIGAGYMICPISAPSLSAITKQ